LMLPRLRQIPLDLLKQCWNASLCGNFSKIFIFVTSITVNVWSVSISQSNHSFATPHNKRCLSLGSLHWQRKRGMFGMSILWSYILQKRCSLVTGNSGLQHTTSVRNLSPDWVCFKHTTVPPKMNHRRISKPNSSLCRPAILSISPESLDNIAFPAKHCHEDWKPTKLS
jgi:hypothetical protein